MLLRMMKRTVLAAGIATLALGGASAQSRVQVGTLECNIEAGIGLIIGSSRAVHCRYRHADGKRLEDYTGVIEKFGLDIGVTRRARMVWAVFAPSRGFPIGALAGNYGGAAADASVVVGGGAKLLVGGSNRTISLQPLSLQGQTGLNVAVGVTSLRLAPAN